jgi:hypothetical protein
VVGVDPKAYDPAQADKIPEISQLLGVPQAALKRALGRTSAGYSSPRASTKAPISGSRSCAYADFTAIRPIDRVYPLGSYTARKLWGSSTKRGPALLRGRRKPDGFLSARRGWMPRNRTRRKRRELGQFRSREVPPKDGLNVELTIDARVQAAEVESRNARAQPKSISRGRLASSSAQPHTGEILGLANYPSRSTRIITRPPPRQLPQSRHHPTSSNRVPPSRRSRLGCA